MEDMPSSGSSSRVFQDVKATKSTAWFGHGQGEEHGKARDGKTRIPC